MCQKKFTKSAFKIALECPRRLYYAYDSKLYANQDLTDEFLKSLADGGFQVGELAKVYYGIKGDADIDVLDYDEAVEFRKNLMKFMEERKQIVEEIPIYRIGAAIGVHTGPYALGVGIIKRHGL